MVPEWLIGTDCKSVGLSYAGSNPAHPIIDTLLAGSGNRTRASCLEGKGTTIIQNPQIEVVTKLVDVLVSKTNDFNREGSSPSNFNIDYRLKI